MIACYCRVSSDTQPHDSQREEIKRWLHGHQVTLASVTWFEDTETGATLNRPDFERLQKAIFSGEVDTLIFWKLDRIRAHGMLGIDADAPIGPKRLRPDWRR